MVERRGGPATNQTAKVAMAMRDDDRHEVRRDRVRQPLDRRLGGLRLLHHADDLGQHGVRAHLGRAHPQGAGAVERRADDGVAGCLVTGIGSPVSIDSSTAD